MLLQPWKWIVLVGWTLAVAAVGVLAQLHSPTSLAALLAFAIVPPSVLWFAWKRPVQTLSEQIYEVKR